MKKEKPVNIYKFGIALHDYILNGVMPKDRKTRRDVKRTMVSGNLEFKRGVLSIPVPPYEPGFKRARKRALKQIGALKSHPLCKQNKSAIR